MAFLRKIGSFVVLSALVASSASAQTSLFFSEYIEGTSFNKCLEIFNNTGASVDLTLVTLELYSNGAASPTFSTALSGTLISGDVVVVCNPNITDPSPADILAGTVNHNGDDAFVMYYDGVIVDSIGQVGVDPGSAWGAAPTTTVNATLRRKGDVCLGDIDPSNAYDPSIEWDGFPVDTLDGLGQHTTICTPVANDAKSWGAVKSLF